MKRFLTIFITILTLYTYSSISAANTEKSLSFQGQLFESNAAKTGSVNATFTFYDAVTDGNVTGSPIAKTVTVNNGYFGTQFTESDTTGVDFNQQLYLEISINGTTLSPRTTINPTVSSLKTFGTFSYSSAPTVGPAGSLYFNTTDNALYTSDGTSWTTASSSWLTNGTTTYYTAGNVGIGTSTPNQKLVVGHATLPTSISIDGVTLRFIRQNSASTTAANNFSVVNGDASSATGYNSLIFAVRSNADIFTANLMGLSANGNLALGTTGGAYEYDARFVIMGSSATTSQMNLRSSRVAIVSGNVIGGINFSSNDTSLTSPGTTTASIQALANTTHTASALGTDLVFTTTNGTTTSEALRILGNGNVGIGTSTPGAKFVIDSLPNTANYNSLLINGNGSNNHYIMLTRGANPTQGLMIARGATPASTPYTGASYIRTSGGVDQGLQIQSGLDLSSVYGSLLLNTSGGAITMGSTTATTTINGLVQFTGNVGIATTTPGYQLTVEGSAFANSIYLPNSSGTSTGVIYLGTTPFITNYGGVNTFIGSNAGNSTTTANNSVAVGYQSQMFVISGGANTSVGHLSLGALTTGTNNTAFGQGTLRNITDSANNVAVGRQALNALVNAGGGNTVIGGNAAMTVQYSTTTTAIGYTSLFSSTDAGTDGVFIGSGTGRSISGGIGNTFLGTGAGGTGTKTGSYNVLVGRTSGSNLTTGSNNIVIGSNNLYLPSATGNNQLNIGNLIYGTGLDGVTSTLSSGNIGIGTSTPGSKFTVAGAILSTDLLGGITTLSVDASGNIIRTPSDQKLKTNVETLTSALDKVNAMRGVSYNWIDTNRFGTSTEIGFIAQELETIVPEVVKSGGEYKSVNYQNLTALLTEAIKELSAKFNNLSEVVKTKFVDAEKVKTHEIQSDKLCLGSTCVTEDQLRQLLQQSNMHGSQPAVVESTTTVSEPTAEVSTPEQPVVELEPTPEPSPEPVTQPTE